MTPQLIRLLSFGLVILIYLFFFRVLRAVWVGVRPARVPAARRIRPAPVAAEPTHLVIRTPPERQGERYPLSDDLSVGRAAGCEITIDDSYASQVHARIFRRDEQLLLEDLGSTNGTYLNRQKVGSATVITPHDQIQVGSTVFEVDG